MYSLTTSTHFQYDREIRDLVFLFNCISGSTDLNIDRFVTFVSHDRSRFQNPAYCKTTTFQTSFSNRIVKPWNTICRLVTSDKFSSLRIFNNYLRATFVVIYYFWYWHALHTVPLSQLLVPPFIIYSFITAFRVFLLDFTNYYILTTV